MKSFLTLIVVLAVLIAIVGSSGILFYLTKTSEIERANQTPLLIFPAPQR